MSDAGRSQTCATPGCEREVQPGAKTKCCLSCVIVPAGVHLAWCQVRNGEHHSQVTAAASDQASP